MGGCLEGLLVGGIRDATTWVRRVCGSEVGWLGGCVAGWLGGACVGVGANAGVRGANTVTDAHVGVGVGVDANAGFGIRHNAGIHDLGIVVDAGASETWFAPPTVIAACASQSPADADIDTGVVADKEADADTDSGVNDCAGVGGTAMVLVSAFASVSLMPKLSLSPGR